MLQWASVYENDLYIASNNVTSINTCDTMAMFYYSFFFGYTIKNVTLYITGSYYYNFKALNDAYYSGVQTESRN